ncbi:hypothetical protein [Sneathiella limimaris]|uniref:hypothetical protein n=1 Tax=Sneathiella limimaris TaxID=1964213 RepID=UPI00146DDBF9|nr:hypothetical protein [Sneathiella limimaris]
MQPVELKSLVNEFKGDFSGDASVDRKTVADRANMANSAALDMLADLVSDKNSTSFLEKGRQLHSLTAELGDITEVVEELGSRS